MQTRGFTLVELLVVIAIIAILAAILFPVFSQAKVSAKQSQSLAQMRQLSASVLMYASDHDDFFVPASNRPPVVGSTPLIWTEALQSYVKNTQIFVTPDSGGAYSSSWSNRHHQSVGYSDATGVDPLGGAVEGAALPGTEGFAGAANFSRAEEPSLVGLFAVTANAPANNFTTRHRGYVFNPYNGLNSPDGDYSKGLPLIADRDLVTTPGDVNYPNSPTLSAGRLKPIFARFGADGRNNGRTPVVFADGHAKVYSARALNSFGTVIWRFR
ncbi:MAG: prepilin-type N-terminal cleavage/methylation domain-containing protein [Fimbriimonadaceae bacterium]|jgi:prepilin-type N-terminal cleavage/methylation domain-containing protein/prepilin-type processing-associated H-X9-DG protein|nr:prepilin-type N-terminal cleavage/methylation domain-containing protein [Fimbriimonadaceae bacterium]